ncbi:hypothetical protein, partial [Pseudomonas sp.]|uniref:hypothetical protein n=1 Tax=Pseudomonas sp. TaxID=306 RepID=UPI0028AE1EC0
MSTSSLVDTSFTPPQSTEQVRGISRLQCIDEQRMAIAFERLALVSQVSGPDMLSATDHWDAPNWGGLPAGRSSGQASSLIAMHRQFPAKMLG